MAQFLGPNPVMAFSYHTKGKALIDAPDRRETEGVEGEFDLRI
jgi:hypothetical protein